MPTILRPEDLETDNSPDWQDTPLFKAYVQKAAHQMPWCKCKPKKHKGVTIIPSITGCRCGISFSEWRRRIGESERLDWTRAALTWIDYRQCQRGALQSYSRIKPIPVPEMQYTNTVIRPADKTWPSQATYLGAERAS